MIDLGNLPEQQKNQRALKIKNKISKQTHGIKVAQSLSSTNKKLEEVIESTKNFGELIEK